MHRLMAAAIAAAVLLALTTASRSPRKPTPMRRNLRSSRSGPSRCPTIGSSGRSPASPSTTTTTSGSSTVPRPLVDDEKGAQKSPPETRCCIAPPPVLQFSADGKLLSSWGGPGDGYDWPKTEHGIHVDKDGNVWLAGNGKDDHQILKFTPDGKFLQQIGKAGDDRRLQQQDRSSAAPRTW